MATIQHKTIFYVVLFFVITSLISCEGSLERNGVILSEDTSEPIDSVKISYFNRTAFSDSIGNFDLNVFVGCAFRNCSEFEMLLEKKGFETKYVNLTQDYGLKTCCDSSKVKILMKSSLSGLREREANKMAMWISRTIMFVSLGTIIFLFFIKLKFKFVWIIFILWGNLLVEWNIFTDLIRIEYFNFVLPNFALVYWNCIMVPFGTLIFWGFYLTKKRTSANNVFL